MNDLQRFPRKLEDGALKEEKAKTALGRNRPGTKLSPLWPPAPGRTEPSTCRRLALLVPRTETRACPSRVGKSARGAAQKLTPAGRARVGQAPGRDATGGPEGKLGSAHSRP